MTVNAFMFWELDVKSPPTIRGKQVGTAVVVTVTVDVDTDVIVLATPTEGQVGLDVTVVVIVLEAAVQLGCVLAGPVVEDEELEITLMLLNVEVNELKVLLLLDAEELGVALLLLDVKVDELKVLLLLDTEELGVALFFLDVKVDELEALLVVEAGELAEELVIVVEINIHEQAELNLDVENWQCDRKVGIPVVAV